MESRFSGVKKSKTFKKILNKYNLRSKKVLDIGCGLGQYLVNFGNHSMGLTSTLSEVEYGKNNNINIIKGNAELIDDLDLEIYDAVWANNLIEHILSPHSFLVKLKKVSNDKTVLILGVPVFPFFVYLLKLKKFRGSLASNHINFFTKKTLEKTVERSGWEILESRSFLFSNKFIDCLFSIFSPHIYVVARNIVNFNYPVKKINEWKDDDYYKNLLNIIK